MKTRSSTRKQDTSNHHNERVGATTRSMARREAALSAKANKVKITSHRRLVKQQNILETRWPTLLPELLGAVSDCLPIRDLVRFRSVCKGWRAAPCGRSAMFKFSKSTPWLIIYSSTTTSNSDDPKCFLYHPTNPESCTLKLPSLHGATCLVSKFGWLLAHRGGRLFFSNPFSLETIRLPAYPRVDPTRLVYTFVSLPTSPDCAVFIMHRKNSAVIQVSFCRPGDGKWDTRDLEVDDTVFGPIKEVQCCICSEDKECSCGYKRESGLYCFDTKGRCLICPVLGDGSWSVVPSAAEKYTKLFDELTVAHQSEWLRRFGGKGFLFSTCALSMKMDGSPGIGCCHYGIGGSGAGVNRVSAALIEPRF